MRINISTLFTSFSFLMIGWLWVPLIPGQLGFLSAYNIISIAFALAFPFFLLLKSFYEQVVTARIFISLLLWVAICAMSFLIHNTPDGFSNLRLLLPNIFLGWGLTYTTILSGRDIKKLAFLGLVSTLIMLELSVILTGNELVSGLLVSISQGGSEYFLFHILRPALNVFSGSGDITYNATQVNAISSTILVLALASLIKKNTERMPLFKKAVVAASFLFTFLVFSTSTAIVLAVYVIAFVTLQMFGFRNFWQLWLCIAGILIAIILIPVVFSYIDAKFAEDEFSRGSRLEQYIYALGVINQNIIFGAGYFEVGRFQVHNFILFSWASSGLPALACVILVYSAFGQQILHAIKRNPGNTPILLAIGMNFYIRTLVGGAGGIPTSSAMISIVIICVLANTKPTERITKTAIAPSDVPRSAVRASV